MLLSWDSSNNRYVPGEREKVCAAFQSQYRSELADWRDTGNVTNLVEGTILVARLYQEIGKLSLVCHCVPKQCHCEFIKLGIPWTIRQLSRR